MYKDNTKYKTQDSKLIKYNNVVNNNIIFNI